MATEWETKMSVALANLEAEVEKVKKTVRNATELRYSPATKKEIRDYIDWSINQRKKHKANK